MKLDPILSLAAHNASMPKDTQIGQNNC